MISVNNTANGSILSIKNIAQTLVKNAELVEEWLSVHHSGKKILSFDQDAEAEFPSTKDDPRVEEARISIIESTEILRDLLRGPGEVLRGVCWGVCLYFSLPCIAETSESNNKTNPITSQSIILFSNAYTAMASSIKSR